MENPGYAPRNNIKFCFILFLDLFFSGEERPTPVEGGGPNAAEPKERGNIDKYRQVYS